MVNEKIIQSLNFLSEEMIFEAQNSCAKKIRSHHNTIHIIAACLCIVTFISILKINSLRSDYNNPIVTENEPNIELTENDIVQSNYAIFYPDLSTYGFSLNNAGISGKNYDTFDATILSDSTHVRIIVKNKENTDYVERLVEFKNIESYGNIDKPIFLQNEFSVECMEYCEIIMEDPSHPNRPRLLRWQFGILTDDYVAEYIIYTDYYEDAVQVFKSISKNFN